MGNRRNLIKKLGTMALVGTLASPINANSAETWTNIQAYGDTREHATFNITAGASNLPLGLDFFGIAIGLELKF